MILLNGHSDRMKKLFKLPEPKVIISLEVHSDRNEKKIFFQVIRTKIKFLTYAKAIKL